MNWGNTPKHCLFFCEIEEKLFIKLFLLFLKLKFMDGVGLPQTGIFLQVNTQTEIVSCQPDVHCCRIVIFFK